VQRNSYVWRGILVLLGVILLVTAPVLGSGLLELGRAQRSRASNDHLQAARSFELAARRLPWRTELWEQAGLQALAAQAPGDAIRSLARAAHLSLHGWQALGDAYRQAGDLDSAAAAYQSALKEGASAEVYAGLAQVYRLRGDLEAERAALENQLLLAPDDAAAQYRLGLLLSLVDADPALQHLELASQLDIEYEPVVETLRSTLSQAGLHDSRSQALVTTGRGLALAGEWALARQAFQQAVREDVSSAEAWAWLGEAKQHLGEQGTEELDRALQQDSRSVVIRGLRGLYWKRLGNDRAALSEYQAAAALEPGNPTWFASLGETYARLGDLVAGLAGYQRATQIAPQDPLYWRLLATFCAEYGVQVSELGLPAAQKAVELAPEDPLALDILGWSQLAADQPEAAQETLLGAVERQPEFALAHLHLALVFLRTGERDAAYRELRLALDLDPDGTTGEQSARVLEQYFPR
jgi:tetratricopeptide (TPR) repeat protein